MTKETEALKLALEALEHAAYCVQNNYCPDKMGHDWDDTITSIKEALAQPMQERYFCQRCGKPVNLTTIHTCTPPQIDPNQWAFDNGLEST
jgi:hypothetical protein